MYLKKIAFVSVPLLSALMTGCASHANDDKLDTDVLLLTQKMNALTVELKALKAKQQQEQQELKVAKQRQNSEQKQG